MVGHGERGLLELSYPLEQRLDLIGTIQKAVLGVTVKVNETRMLHETKLSLA